MNGKSKTYFVERKRIAQLAELVIEQYKQMGDERSQIHEWEWENDFDFTILGLMEIYSSYVGGYASQIATRGTVKKPAEGIDLLQEKRFFDEPYFVDWYFAPDNHYFKVKKYVEDVDYLRLLVIQYLRLCQSDSLSASRVAMTAKEIDSSFFISSEENVDALQAITA